LTSVSSTDASQISGQASLFELYVYRQFALSV